MPEPSPAASDQAWLELPDGSLFYLPPRATVGRQPGNDLVLQGETMSRQHAVITAGPGGYTLTDMHSRNGTYVGGQLLTRPEILRDNTEIRFGDVVVRFRCNRDIDLAASDEDGGATQVLNEVQSRECWLLVTDIAGFTTVVTSEGSEAAVRRLHAWMAGARPLVERHAGRINRYVGDAIFAYWPVDGGSPADVVSSLRAFESWRPTSPLSFRYVVHHGSALFSKSEHGEELGGRDVTLAFRMEKIAKRYGAHSMLSAAAVRTLGLSGRCKSCGKSAVDGMTEQYEFYTPPDDWAAP